MNHVRFAIVCLATTGLFTASASAVVIDFGDTSNDPFSIGETYSEDGFTFEVISGTEWEIDTNFGNPASGLIAGFDFAPVTGDTVSVTSDGGGLFTFDAFDFAAFADFSSDTVNLVGLVNNIPTEALNGVGSASTVFTVAADPGFANPIDELRIVVASIGVATLELDNFVFTEVIPTPSAFPVGLIGLGAMTLRRRRRVA